MSDVAVAGYELWDMESRNLLDDFDTESEALEVIRELIELNGVACTGALALTYVGTDGRMTTLATGDALVARLEAVDLARRRLPA